MPSSPSHKRIYRRLATAVAVIAIALSGLLLIVHHSHRTRLSQSTHTTQETQMAQGVANIQELAQPWSSKTFTFHNQETRENVSALVIRLPEGAPDQPGSYWAFSLKPMFGNCQLEYITDLQKLSSAYDFQAKHPMVGDPCKRAVFDPLQMADMPKDTWARGAIVKGYAFRPPLAIQIQIQSDQLVAAKME